MISALVLAAGRSRRMGTQKLLLPFAGKTVVGHIVDQILEGGLRQVSVVVGSDRGAIADALVGRPVRFVDNPDPEGDMLSSIRCGLRSLTAQCAAALIALGDQPGVHAGLVAQLVEQHVRAGEGITLPAFQGKRGHPVIISAKFFPEVLAGFDGVGLHALLAAHPAEVREMAASTAAVLDDLDFPADYQSALARQAIDSRNSA